MKTYNNLYEQLTSYENLELAFKKARKHKTLKDYVINFEIDLKENLLKLQFEPKTFTYQPNPIKTFIVRDPKTRKIGASDFRDRVVYHALCNIIAPLLGNSFVFDSFANQKGKGTHKAIKRFEQFLPQLTFNHKQTIERERERARASTIIGYALKADIRHYFENISHNVLLKKIRNRIKDEKVIWLIEIILKNHKTGVLGKGMPLGNLTSQFFANFYLDEFDHFVKHELKAKYYLRYVDDFVILHLSQKVLMEWRIKIEDFLEKKLEIYLHPEKSRIIELSRGTTLLGFKIFSKYRLLKKSNSRRIWKRLKKFKQKYDRGELNRDEILMSLESWLAYAEFANTYKFRKK